LQFFFGPHYEVLIRYGIGTYQHTKKVTGPIKDRAGRKVTKTKKCTSRKITALLGAKLQKRVRIIK